MTRKELIDFGEMFLEVNKDSKNSNTYEFIDAAVKLLKQESITKDNCSLDDFIEYGKKAFGVELTVKKSDNPDTYAKLFETTENDLSEELEKEESVLDKIRAEIEQIVDEEQKHDKKWAIGLRYAVKIIDKYKTESEEI